MGKFVTPPRREGQLLLGYKVTYRIHSDILLQDGLLQGAKEECIFFRSGTSFVVARYKLERSMGTTRWGCHTRTLVHERMVKI